MHLFIIENLPLVPGFVLFLCVIADQLSQIISIIEKLFRLSDEFWQLNNGYIHEPI